MTDQQPSPDGGRNHEDTGRPALDIDGLTVTYRDPNGAADRVVRAVTDLTLTIQRGRTLALIGESGCGKTTAALAVLGMLPAAATVESGTATVTTHDHAAVRVRGGRKPSAGPGVRTYAAPAADAGVGKSPMENSIDLLNLSSRDLRRVRWKHIAYVPQGSISAFNPIQRISRHFRQTAQAHDLRSSVAEQRAYELLAAVHLEPGRIWNSYPHELSGGTRQRVAIALAMLLKPAVIILDEPTTALDVLTQEAVLKTLLELQEQTGVSYLAITHDLAVASAMAHDVVTMYAGRAVEYGSAEQVLSQPVHPYTRGLMRSMPTVDSDIEAEPIGGYPPSLAALPTGCAFHPRCPRAIDPCREGAAPAFVSVHDRMAACPVVAHEPDSADGPDPAAVVGPHHGGADPDTREERDRASSQFKSHEHGWTEGLTTGRVERQAARGGTALGPAVGPAPDTTAAAHVGSARGLP